MTLRDFFLAEYAITRGLKKKAAYQVLLTLDRWKEFLGREPETSDLTNLSVQRFLMHRREKVAVGTVLKDRNSITGIWNYMARQDRSLPFPTLPPMSPVRRIPRAYTAADVSRLLRVSLSLPGTVAGLPRSHWWASIQRVYFETAERITPVLSIRWKEVDLTHTSLTFLAENRKGGRSDIQRDISRETAEWMDRLKREENDLVWPWDRGLSSLWAEHHRICALAQVTARGFHGFRRSCASYLTLAGSAELAADQLAHESPSVTRSRYIDPSIARPAVSAVQLLPKLDIHD